MDNMRLYSSLTLIGFFLFWVNHSYGKEDLMLGYVPLKPLFYHEKGMFKEV